MLTEWSIDIWTPTVLIWTMGLMLLTDADKFLAPVTFGMHSKNGRTRGDDLTS
jgi:hypothetical protein